MTINSDAILIINANVLSGKVVRHNFIHVIRSHAKSQIYFNGHCWVEHSCTRARCLHTHRTIAFNARMLEWCMYFDDNGLITKMYYFMQRFCMRRAKPNEAHSFNIAQNQSQTLIYFVPEPVLGIANGMTSKAEWNGSIDEIIGY